MTSLLTEEQTKLIEALNKPLDEDQYLTPLEKKLTEIINLQNKVIEKCREQRDWGHDGWDPEVFDRELREIMDGKA